MKFNDHIKFLDVWFSEIDKLGIIISDLPLDHLGYGVSFGDEYDEFKLEFLKLGKLFRETRVSDRRVAIFQLKNPLKYKDHSISAIELIEPKAGETPITGYEHAEFTINGSFEDFVKKYPKVNWDTSNINRPNFSRLKLVFDNGLELKFNRSPILES